MFRKILFDCGPEADNGDSGGNNDVIILHAFMVLYVVSAKRAAFCTLGKKQS